MPKDDLSIKQRAVLFILMSEAREVSNPDLKSRHGIEFKAGERRKLNELKLVTTRTDVRPYLHELTDAGWRWCADELSAERPPRAGAFGAAFYAVMQKVDRYFDRAQVGLEAVFPPDDDTAAPVARAPAGTLPAADVEAEIRKAYARLAPRARDWVGLADLRRLLGGIDRSEVDAALVRLDRTPVVHLAPESNRKGLTPEDRDATVRVGGEDRHLIAIEDA